MLVLLTGCTFGDPKTDTYTSKSGETTLIESNSQSCERSCNADYSRCMDTMPAQSNPVPGSPPGMFGAAADCRNSLQKCLPACKSR